MSDLEFVNSYSALGQKALRILLQSLSTHESVMSPVSSFRERDVNKIWNSTKQFTIHVHWMIMKENVINLVQRHFKQVFFILSGKGKKHFRQLNFDLSSTYTMSNIHHKQGIFCLSEPSTPNCDDHKPKNSFGSILACFFCLAPWKVRIAIMPINKTTTAIIVTDSATFLRWLKLCMAPIGQTDLGRLFYRSAAVMRLQDDMKMIYEFHEWF